MTITALQDAYPQPLTPGQQEGVAALFRFLHSDGSCFILSGYAGTGKTFILKGITDYLNVIGIPFRLAAPTGRAALVMKEACGHEATTIHSMIYTLDELKIDASAASSSPESQGSYDASDSPDYVDAPGTSAFSDSEDEDTGTHTYFFDLKEPDDREKVVYIIDEASMVSNVKEVQQRLRFGSGALLDDLLDYIQWGVDSSRKHKVIFVGDAAQLPPVQTRGNDSPALSPAFFQDRGIISCTESRLTDVVRQSAQSGILKNVSSIRDCIQKGIYNQIDFDWSGSDVFSVNPDEFMETYLNACQNDNNRDITIIAHSNAQVLKYNQMIREHFFPGQKGLAVGDKVLVTQNNYLHPVNLYNGDIGRVTAVADQAEYRTIPLNKPVDGHRNIVGIPLVFREVSIDFSRRAGSPLIVTALISETLLEGKDRDLTQDQQNALFVDFTMRYNGKNGRKKLKPGSPEFANVLKTDPYYNCLRIKYGYAVTCHKAQGGEWDTVFVDCKTTMNALSEGYFRWLYTAMTRASGTLYLVSPPKREMFDRLKSGGMRLNEGPLGKIETVKADELAAVPDGFFGNFDEDDLFLRAIYKVVSQAVEPFQIQIVSVGHQQYGECYHFEKGDLRDRVILYYNKKHQITILQFLDKAKNELDDELNQALKPIVGTTVNVGMRLNGVSHAGRHDAGPSHGTASLPDTELRTSPSENRSRHLHIANSEKREMVPFLDDFIASLCGKMGPTDIQQIDLKILTDCHLRITFLRREEQAQFNYYFNKKGIPTKAFPLSNQSNSQPLIDTVTAAMAEK